MSILSNFFKTSKYHKTNIVMGKYDNLFMDIALRTALESNCERYKVGAVAVKSNRIIVHGYNGTVPGFINCSDKFKGVDFKNGIDKKRHHDWSSAFEIHAEMNVISFAAKEGISLKGTVLYCSHTPCNNCLKHLIQSGVKKVIYKNEYIDKSNLIDRKMLLDFITVKQI